MKNMWKGWIIEESLSDTKVLSRARITNTVLEENEESGKKVMWKIRTVEVDDSKIDGIAKELEKIIKPAWYTHFTDGKSLIVVFHGRSFRLKIKKTGEDRGVGITQFWVNPEEKKIWKAAFAYGTGKGKVDSRYMLKIE